jgi:hypothetical protein
MRLVVNVGWIGVSQVASPCHNLRVAAHVAADVLTAWPPGPERNPPHSGSNAQGATSMACNFTERVHSVMRGLLSAKSFGS